MFDFSNILFSYKSCPPGRKTRSSATHAVKKGVKMAGIFTRKEVSKILSDENLTPEERADSIFSLYGRAIDDGYVTRGAAEAAQNAAVKTAQEAWEKDHKPQEINVKETEEYKSLLGEFEGFKVRQTARNSDEFKEVKPKFFDVVYDQIDRADGAKPVSEQLAEMRKEYEEYFTVPANNPAPKLPQFGAKPEGAMPKGEEGAVAAFTNAWGFKK